MTRLRGRRGSTPYPYRVTAWLLILALLAPALPADAQEAPAAPDIARLIPANAVGVAALDFRSDEPTVKLMVEQYKPQERAVGAAMISLLGQLGLATLASGLDFDTDVLPWVGRRAYVAGVPAPGGGGPPWLMALVEVKDDAAALKALEVILPKAVTAAKGKLFQRQIGDVVLRHVAIPGFGHLQLMLREGALALSRNAGLLEEWAKQPAGGSADAEWSKAMRLVSPGPFVVSLTPAVAGPLGEPAAAGGVAAAAISSSASQAGSRMEIALQTNGGPAGQVTEQLARMSITGAALGVVPESAVAVVSAAPLDSLLESLKLKPLVSMGVRGMLGTQAETLMARIQPALDNALKGEIAVALMALTPEPRLLAVVAEPDEGAAAGAVSALRDALATVPGAKVSPREPSGFVLALPPRKGKLLKQLHVASAGKWLLAATDAETLAAGLATAQAPRPAGLAENAGLKGVQEQIGGPGALLFFADTRALGRALTALAHQQLMKGEKLDIPAKYFVRLVDAFLLPLGGAGLSVSARQGAGRLTLFQQVDWKSAAGAGAAAPAMAAIIAAVAIPAFVRAQKSGRESAALQVLKSLRNGEEVYRTQQNRYGDLNQLKAEVLSPVGEGGIEPTSGYRFSTKNVTAKTYLIIAEAPKPDMTTYTLKETGEVTP